VQVYGFPYVGKGFPPSPSLRDAARKGGNSSHYNAVLVLLKNDFEVHGTTRKGFAAPPNKNVPKRAFHCTPESRD